MIIRSCFFGILFLAVFSTSVANPQYPADDPRWTDGDTTNDPNTCHEAGANCRTIEDWQRGWLQACRVSGRQHCGQESSDSPPPALQSGDSSQQSSNSSQQSSNSLPSTQQSGATSQRTSAVRQQPRNSPPCPIGHVCVSHWPSGDFYVFEVGINCCYPWQAIFSIEH